MNTFQEMRVGVALPFGQHAGVKATPSLVVFCGVLVVGLADKEVLSGRWGGSTGTHTANTRIHHFCVVPFGV